MSASHCKLNLLVGIFHRREGKMSKNLKPKYAHLEYDVLYSLDISITEYWYLDMVYQLSRFGWCNKKLENISYDMHMTKRGVMKLRDRLIEKKLIIKGRGNKVKTSEKVNKVYFSDTNYNSKSELSSKKVNKVHPKSEQSITKTSVENNKRLTKNKENKNFKGTISPQRFAEMRDRLFSRPT